MATTDETESLVGVLRGTMLALVRREGSDLSARQLAVCLTCYLESEAQTVRGLAATLDQERDILTLTPPAEPQATLGAIPLVTHDFLDRPWPAGDRSPGPVPVPGAAPVELPLGRAK